MKRVLMVAYHFPPLAVSSGIQRTLRFVQHLPHFGWQPMVLSAHVRSYERVSHDLHDEVPKETVVRRAFALDTARHLAIAGRYLGFMARPDRWISWKFDAVRQGMRMIREHRPHAIWSTYPIATAHLIGAELHRRSGLPWIADFRDPMAQAGYPADPLVLRQFADIEKHVVNHAARSAFTTQGAARIYRCRYPAAAERIVVVENGYDEQCFVEAERIVSSMPVRALEPGTPILLHSGIVYPSERDPTQLFVALGRLRRAGTIHVGDFKVRFRAAVHEAMLHSLACKHNVEPFIETLPPIGYMQALQEMLRADALLLMQASGCNDQVPAKVYEYLRAARPILCLADPVGDTVAVLNAAGLDAGARISSADEIEALLPRFLASLRDAVPRLASASAVAEASRHRRAAMLASMLDSTTCAV